MALITRQGKGSKLTIQEMDGNLEYLEGLAQGGGSTNPIIRSFEAAGFDPDRWEQLMGAGIIFGANEVPEMQERFYGIASVETWQKTLSRPENGRPGYPGRGLSELDSFMQLNKIGSSKTNYMCSVETYTRTRGYEYEPNWIDLPIQNTHTEPDTDFIEKALGVSSEESILKVSKKYEDAWGVGSFHYAEILDRIWDKGIIEKGSIGGKSQIGNLWSISRGYGTWPRYPVEAIDRIIDRGLFIVNFSAGGRFSLYNEFYGTEKPKGVWIGFGETLVTKAQEIPAMP
jgi:hypothetical protein